MSGRAGPGRILYLLTSDVSHLLVAGQLGILVERGFDVHVGVAVGESERIAGSPPSWDHGVHVHALPFVRSPRPWADLVALVATVRLIRSLRPDAVHASTPKAGLLGLLAARWLRVGVRIFVVRGLRWEGSTGWRREVQCRLDALAARSATHVVFNSVSLQDVARLNGVVGEREGVVFGAGSGNGVDTDRFSVPDTAGRDAARRRLGLRVDEMVVGSVGRLTNDKGIADLVDAFDHDDVGDEVRLLLVGSFDDPDALDAEVQRRIAAHPRITLVPWLSDPAVAYAAMDVLAFTSRREGLPNVVLEAQACGVPVVGYAATGTVDAVSEDAVLVPIADVAALRAALLAVLGDEPLRRDSAAARSAWVRTHFDRTRFAVTVAEHLEAWIADAAH